MGLDVIPSEPKLYHVRLISHNKILFVVGDGAPLIRGLKSSLQTFLYYGSIAGHSIR